MSEPAHKRWLSPDGLACVINKTAHIGIYCGYVRVPKGHPFFGRSCSGWDDDGFGVDVHGGVTFAGPEAPGEPSAPDEWWIGFDCGHAGDLVPFMPDYIAIGGLSLKLGGVYRDEHYVTRECESLAYQLWKTMQT